MAQMQNARSVALQLEKVRGNLPLLYAAATNSRPLPTQRTCMFHTPPARLFPA